MSVPTAGAYSASSRVQNVALGSAQTHTIRISASSAAIYLGGFTLYNGDRNAGVQIYDSGFSGATVATFLADK